jgi:hypothetical protein
MFCQNTTCGTEVASQYKFCPKCGGQSFGPKQVQIRPSPAVHAPAGNRPPVGLVSQVVPANPSASTQKTMIFVGIGIVVLVLLAGFGYQQMKVVELQAGIEARETAARTESERSRIALIEAQKKQEELSRLEVERKRNEESQAERKRVEIEQMAQLAAEAKKQQETELRRQVERKSLSIVERKAGQILNSAYPLAFDLLKFQDADARGVKKAEGAYVATIRLNYLNLLNMPHYLDIAFNYGENGESQEWIIVDFSDFITPNKLTVETLFQIVR